MRLLTILIVAILAGCVVHVTHPPPCGKYDFEFHRADGTIECIQ